jgi:gamma-glutamyltranspeptidase / glutathione hydrolase
MKIAVTAAFVLVAIIDQSVFAADLSPGKWPATARERAEKREIAGWTPTEARSISGTNGVISATESPIAVQAGLEALRQGGTAADAAATVALTQITTQLGSVVSYAGIMALVYYDVKTGKVYSMDAEYNSYYNETEPKTIPVADLGPLNTALQAAIRAENTSGQSPAASANKGRETLVPGFMAGIAAMHGRFGRLPFADLFEPAIWYAEQGVIVNPILSWFFDQRLKFLSRTPEGRRFLRQAGNDLPRPGDRFLQPELAKTLQSVAKHGSQDMYTGPWGQEFVKIVQREGGKVTLDDMARYRAIWTEPTTSTFLGHRVYTAGLPGLSAYNLFPALNLAEELKLNQRQPFWKDPAALAELQQISDVITGAPDLDPKIADFLSAKGVDISPSAQLTKSFARALVPLLEQLYAEPRNTPRHSNAVVVVDKEGNVAAITHSINSVIWGDTGIVVGGIPIPDSAGIQQARLSAIKPGDRVPNEMMQTIVFKGEAPMLATAAIGSSIPETLKLLLSVVGQGLDLETVQAAPPLLSDFSGSQPEKSARQRKIVIPEGAYSADFVTHLENQGVKVTKIPSSDADGIRGTVVAVQVNPKSREKQTVETLGVQIFGGAE